MNKFDYLCEAFKKRAYIRKTFLMSIFSLVHDTPANKRKLEGVPYAAIRDDENKEIYFIDETNQKVVIEHPDFKSPLFYKNEKMTVDVDTNVMIKEKIETTVGIFITNIIVFYESFNHKVKYYNSPITTKLIKSIIEEMMVDNPKDGEEVPEGKASVNECLKVTKQLDYLEGMNQVFVKASSTDVLTVHPDVIKLRDKLLDGLEKEGKLNDPTAVAKVIDEVIAFDAKIQFSGPSKDFFINYKLIDNARKKMFIIFDMIPDFNTGKYTLLRKSLNEGWDQKHFPEYINTAVSASFDRGSATGQGGAEVKVAILLTDRIIAEGEDCGTKRTEPVKLTKHNFKGWVGGYYYSTGDKEKLTLLSSKDTGLIGSTINMRVPQYCVQPEGNLCKRCCGDKVGKIETRVSAEVVYIFTQFMLTSMKSMHVSQLKTVTIDLNDVLK